MPGCVVLAVDIGGKGIRCRLVRVLGGGLIELIGSTSCYLGVCTIDQLVAHVKSCRPSYVNLVLVACAGEITGNRVVVKSPNAQYLDNTDLATELEHGIGGIGVMVFNDMQAAAVGMYEMTKQAGISDDLSKIIAITWSSGIGLRWVVNGAITSDTTEAGHMKIDISPTAPLCGCGGHGCVEAFIGGVSLTKIVEADSNYLSFAAETSQKNAKALTVLDQAYAADEQWARDRYSQIAWTMGAFLANLLMVDPDVGCILWKGTLVRHAMTLDGIESMIRASIEYHAMVKRVATVPFILVPGPEVAGEPDDDTFIGLVRLAMDRSLI